MSDVREELAVPHFEDRLWAELAVLHGAGAGDPRAAGASPARRHRRLPFAIAGAAAVVAVAVAAGVLVGSRPEVVVGTGPGTVPRSGSGTPPTEAVLPPGTSTPPASAGPFDPNGVLDAVNGAPVVIVHTTEGLTESWYDEVTAARRVLSRGTDGAVQVDGGWPEAPSLSDPGEERSRPGFNTCDPATKLELDEQGQFHQCDPGVVAPPTVQEHLVRTVDHCKRIYADQTFPVVREPGLAYVGLYLRTGHLKEDGRVVVDGRELVRVSNAGGAFVFLIDPVSALPVQEIHPSASGGEPTVKRYARLPRTAENLALLSPPVPAGYTPASPDAISRPSDLGGMGAGLDLGRKGPIEDCPRSGP